MDNSSDVIAFWKNAGYEKWFSRDDAFDAAFDQRFRGLHFRAARRSTPNAVRAGWTRISPPHAANSSTGWTRPRARWRC